MPFSEWGLMDNTMTLDHIALSLPLTKELRDELNRLAAAYVETRCLLAPLRPPALSAIAGDFLADSAIDIKYKAFAMVCLGNALWRPAFASVPFERRILIIPECLRNSKLCPAHRDALGILCEGCGNCCISDILMRAESLGYATIVAEGTTAAKHLVENGNADAIIGVGCMESLAKINDLVYKYSVPALAVPLLRGGCEDTLVDTDWLYRELAIRSHEQIISIRPLIKRAKELFTATFTDRLMGQCCNHTDTISREYLLLDGKRIRPVLTLLAYDAFASERNEHARDTLALSVECFHKASLIHDDIEDDDDTRYGVTTLHCRYGTALAINFGDFLIGEGYRLISASGIKGDVLAACLSIAAQGHIDLTSGQGEELYSKYDNSILSVAEVIALFKNKTAAAFRIALQMGAAAAGVSGLMLDHLASLSDAFGIAFQIHDDLEDCRGEGGDILSRNNSLILSIAFETLSSTLGQEFVAALHAGDKETIFDLIQKSAAIDRAESMFKETLSVVYDILDRIGNKHIKITMYQIIAGLFGEYI